MDIALKDFRCFHKPNKISIRPINILVGENSAGKTSFLAATRFVFDLFQRDVRASFNKDPFYLGSFESIAHYRGGRFGRAESFSFELSGFISPRSRKQKENSNHPFNICVEFKSRRSQASISKIVFQSDGFGFKMSFGDDPSFLLSTPSMSEFEVKQEAILFKDELLTLDLTFITFVLRNLKYRISAPGPNAFDVPNVEDLETLEERYTSAIRQLPNEVYASAPVRTRPERTYNPADFSEAPDGAHIPFILAEMSRFDQENWASIRDNLNEFGDASGLFKGIDVKRIGNSESGPFQVVVNMSNRKSNIIDVGYGVSQALPIITDLLRARRGAMFLYQQPEVHLHPRAQAELGTFFQKMVRRSRHHVFIETHSDHLIDRIRMHVRDGDLKTNDVSLLYFERDGHDVLIHSITFDRSGNIIGAPPSYRKFFLQEEMRSLGVNF